MSKEGQIQFLKRDQIDTKKWDECILRSSYPLIYAKSWYLDEQTKWGALVLGDYKAVLPLPMKKKMGVTYISNPMFCQQLGLFSTVKITKQLINLFLQVIPKNKLKYFIRLNHSNQRAFENDYFILRNNQRIELSSTYEIIASKFRKDRKSQIKNTKGIQIEINDGGFKKAIDFFKKHQEQLYGVNKEYVLGLTSLSNAVANNAKVIEVIAKLDDELLGSALYFMDDNIIYQMLLGSTDKGKKLGASTLIIHSMIKKFSNQQIILDFEGSNIPGVAKFFSSFGAVNEPYLEFNKSGFPLLFGKVIS